jgi:hypothetical protein
MNFAKEKADELIKKYSDFVSGYIGSSMLTNTEYPEAILNNAKQCALIAVDEIIFNIDATIFYHKDSNALPLNKEYWQEVKQEIEKL